MSAGDNDPPARKQTIMTNSKFVSLVVSIPVVAGLLTALWVTAASAAPVPEAYRVPGHCVVTTEIKDDGRIITSRSCEFTAKQYAQLKRTGKLAAK